MTNLQWKKWQRREVVQWEKRYNYYLLISPHALMSPPHESPLVVLQFLQSGYCIIAIMDKSKNFSRVNEQKIQFVYAIIIWYNSNEIKIKWESSGFIKVYNMGSCFIKEIVYKSGRNHTWNERSYIRKWANFITKLEALWSCLQMYAFKITAGFLSRILCNRSSERKKESNMI